MVSIGLPVYNGERFITEALTSLLTQSFDNFELIISDNASTDRTKQICEHFAARDNRIRYVRQPTNLGAIPNFNHVFGLARAKYFKWASADDVCAPRFLASCVRLLDTHADVDWCHTRTTHIDVSGQPLSDPDMCDVSYASSLEADMARIPLRTSASPSTRLEAVLLGAGGCIDSYGLFRSDAIRKTRRYLPHFGAEKVFIAEMALAGRYAEVPKTLFFTRVHEAMVSSLTSSDRQQQAMDTSNVRRFAFTRLRLLHGYLSAVSRANVSALERLRCTAVLFRYMGQQEKWRRLMRSALTNSGIIGDHPIRRDPTLRHVGADHVRGDAATLSDSTRPV